MKLSSPQQPSLRFPAPLSGPGSEASATWDHPAVWGPRRAGPCPVPFRSPQGRVQTSEGQRTRVDHEARREDRTAQDNLPSQQLRQDPGCLRSHVDTAQWQLCPCARSPVPPGGVSRLDACAKRVGTPFPCTTRPTVALHMVRGLRSMPHLPPAWQDSAQAVRQTTKVSHSQGPHTEGETRCPAWVPRGWEPAGGASHCAPWVHHCSSLGPSPPVSAWTRLRSSLRPKFHHR